MSSILEVDSVIKSFDRKQVLTDIYLKCSTGDILGMLGRNGVGKSTLLRIIFGTLHAERKFIRIDSKIYDKAYKVRNLLSFLPQFNFLPKSLTVEKVAELYIGTLAQPSFLDDMLLTNIRKNKISSLSGGELRYLEIRLVLSTPSKFVFLDEPFNGSSPILIEKIKELIIAASRNKGIILTDHDYRNVLGVANRYCLIHDGGIKKVQGPEELGKWGYLPTSSDN
jgi:lipopolysaccharide export system ATP-binding protein